MKTLNLYPGEGLDLDFEFGKDVSTWTATGSLLAVGVTVATLSTTRPTTTSIRVTTSGPQSRAVEGRQVLVRLDATDPTRPTIPVVEEVRVNVALETSTAALPSGHQVVWGAAAPAALAWGQGDVCWNSAATVGQPKGWICTVPGTPGTWVSMGNL
jgi:hypothetical protein